MRGFFTAERFGRPQILAALMLLAFLMQCLWLVELGWRTGNVEPAELFRLERGVALWKHGRPPAALDLSADLDTEPGPSHPSVPIHPVPNHPEILQKELATDGYDAIHSPLWYLIASAPLALSHVPLRPEKIRELHRLAAAPFVVFGLLLGASLWYVSRRLFGNAGGYIALALYCFSPGIVRSTAMWSAEPEIGAAGARSAPSLPPLPCPTRFTPRAKLFCGTGGALRSWDYLWLSQWDRSFRWWLCCRSRWCSCSISLPPTWCSRGDLGSGLWGRRADPVRGLLRLRQRRHAGD